MLLCKVTQTNSEETIMHIPCVMIYVMGITFSSDLSRDVRKAGFGISDQVRHKTQNDLYILRNRLED